MKYAKTIAALMLCSFFLKCSQEKTAFDKLLGPDDGGLVYLTQAGMGSTATLSVFPPQDVSKKIINACFGGFGVPKDDITVNFEVDQKGIDSLNAFQTNQGKPPYSAYPAESFSVNQMSVTIPAGQSCSSDYVVFTYYPKLLSTTQDYITALRIKEASGGYKINKQVSSVFLMVSKLAPARVAAASLSATTDCEEPSESAPNGLAAAAVDGKNDTFWHSTWNANPMPPYPHWLLVNMSSIRYITKIGLVRRQGDERGFKTFHLEASADGVTWVNVITAGDMDAATDAEQNFLFLTVKCQYLKLTMTESAVGENYAFLAEFIPYELK